MRHGKTSHIEKRGKSIYKPSRAVMGNKERETGAVLNTIEGVLLVVDSTVDFVTCSGGFLLSLLLQS